MTARPYLYVLSFLFLILANPAHAQKLLLGPMLGHTLPDKAYVWCELDFQGTCLLEIAENPNLQDARMYKKHDFQRGFFVLESLSAETRYYYRVKAAGNPYYDGIYSFKTPPLNGTSGKTRILFSSCSGQSAYDEASAWENIARLDNTDVILQLGDNHYADTTNPDVIAKHYWSHRSSPFFKKATSSIPTYGIWDDHDFGPNNSDGQTKGKEESLSIFKEYWANPAYGQRDNPGIYYSFVRGDVEFIMLDSRYHRTPNKSMKSDNPDKTMLGKKQLDWLRRTLTASQSKIKFICLGSEFQLHSTSDCLSGFRVEQEKILDMVEQIEGTILLSGDRHFVAAYHIRGKTVEVTSGPLGSSNANGKITPDTVLLENKGKLFCVFDIDTTDAEPKVILEVHRGGDGMIRKQEFSWMQINGQEKIVPHE